MKNILFIGGWTRDRNSYNKLFDSCPKDVHLIFLPSYEILDKYPLGESSDAIRQYLKSINVDKTVIAGHSLGGTIAIEFALNFPQMVEKMILVDSGGLKVEQKFFDKAKNAIRDQFINFSRKARENLGTGLRIAGNPRRSFRSLTAAYTHDLRDRLNLLSVETIIIWATRDHIYPLNQGEEFHRLIKDSRLIKVENMDHDWIIHAPEHFWKSIS